MTVPMFVNWSNFSLWGTFAVESMPASRFKVRLERASTADPSLKWAGLCITAIGLLMAHYSKPCSAYCLGSVAVISVGLGTIFYASSLKEQLVCRVHQTRQLHRAATLEEYMSLLRADRRVVYSFDESADFKEWLTQTYTLADLQKVSINDCQRQRMLLDGKEIDMSTPKGHEVYGEAFAFANQTLITYLHWMLQSRYVNDHLQVLVQAKGTCFNLKENKVLLGTLKADIVRSMFTPDVCVLGCIEGKLELNLVTGQLKMSWKSPKAPE